MIVTFGAGLVAKHTTPRLPGALATLVGVGAWVGVATRLGLPVSTTHAIVGSVAGVYFFSHGLDGVNWAGLRARVVVPLLLSPVVALGLTMALLHAWALINVRFRKATECLCLDLEPAPLASNLVVTGNGLALSPATRVNV
jgi:PiT family inorganic phosphate transporter